MKAAIALNRFGLGARPGELAILGADPQGWLLGQLDGGAPAAALPAPFRAPGPDDRTSASITAPLAPVPERPGDPAAVAGAAVEPASGPLLQAFQSLNRMPDNAAAVGRLQREQYVAHVEARVGAALNSTRPMVERLVHFWSNHFALSADRRPQAMLVGAFENEAIRPHVLGRFSDMLMAVERHPAMLLFLDQVRSIGPSSVAAVRAASRGQRAGGLNENLAREILELHTLGVQGGYGQADVQELARALTGWSVTGLGPRMPPVAAVGQFGFAPDGHEPGTRRLLSRDYPDAGEAQAGAMLLDLARQPATARLIAGKLARHFVSDSPPAELIDRLAANFLATEGDLASLYRVLIGHPLAWSHAQSKFKSPWDYAISALRALGENRAAPRAQAVPALFADLGQRVWTPGSPAGYADTTERWAAPDALLKRVEWAVQVCRRTGAQDPLARLEQVLPGVVSDATRAEIARAESPAQGMSLLLTCPEFMRR